MKKIEVKSSSILHRNTFECSKIFLILYFFQCRIYSGLAAVKSTVRQFNHCMLLRRDYD